MSDVTKDSRQKRGPDKHRDRKAPTFSTGDAVLLIDCINDLDFPGGDKILPWALKLSKKLAAFQQKAHRFGLPVIFVNDNFGQWRSDLDDVYRHCTRSGALGRDIARRLKPTKRDYFILKPKHSAFYATSLSLLLQHLKIKRLILTGISTNLCVLFTAHDAHMQGLEMIVLSDCCAAESDFDHDMALDQLARFCDAKVCRSDQFLFGRQKLRWP